MEGAVFQNLNAPPPPKTTTAEKFEKFAIKIQHTSDTQTVSINLLPKLLLIDGFSIPG